MLLLPPPVSHLDANADASLSAGTSAWYNTGDDANIASSAVAAAGSPSLLKSARYPLTHSGWRASGNRDGA